MTLEEALSKRAGKKLVFTNGVFDVLHAGHVRYLEQARALGDMLIVGINSDASVRKLGKGPDRPINPEADRIAVIEALRFVDGAVLFEETTPNEIIAALKPEIHVKGGDYDPDSMPETSIVRSYGGKVVILPLLEGRSSTAVIRRLGLE